MHNPGPCSSPFLKDQRVLQAALWMADRGTNPSASLNHLAQVDSWCSMPLVRNMRATCETRSAAIEHQASRLAKVTPVKYNLRTLNHPDGCMAAVPSNDYLSRLYPHASLDICRCLRQIQAWQQKRTCLACKRPLCQHADTHAAGNNSNAAFRDVLLV